MKFRQAQIKVIPLTLIVLIFLSLVVMAIPLYLEISTPEGVTSNRSVELEWNWTTDNLANMTFNWNGTNFSIYDENLVLMYNFNNLSALGENDTHVFDISGNGNNGTVTGATFNATGGLPQGNYDGAFEFDGVNDYITIGSVDEIDYLSNFTISMWVKPIEAGGDTTGDDLINDNLAGGDKFFNFRLNSNLGLRFFYYNSSADEISTSSINNVVDLNSFQHITLVFTEEGNVDKIKFYVNGLNVSDNLDVLNFTGVGSTHSWKIGANRGSERFFNGSIDEVRIWNNSFNDNEMKQLYYSNLKKFDSDSWNLYINQTNASSGFLAQGSYNYFSCATNSSGSENCSEIKSIERVAINRNITSNFSLSIGNIMDNFYGTNTHGFYLGNATTIDSDDDGTLDTPSNITWHREQFLNSNMDNYRIDTNLENYANEDGTFDGGFSPRVDTVKWAYDNNKKVLVIINYMPEWLANKTSGFCNSTYWRSCSPNNFTRWEELVNDTLYNITNAHEYDSAIEIEVWNEPQGAIFWLNNLSSTNTTRYSEYNKLYNSTYNAVKDYNSSIVVGGSSGNMGTEYKINFVKSFLGNFSQQMDFASIHPYASSGFDNRYFNSDVMLSHVNGLIGNCTEAGANCSRIILSEWNDEDSELKNTSSFNDEFSTDIAYVYQSLLNNYPSNITSQIYEWSQRYKYGSNYPEYPQKWAMVSEPDLDNELTIAYNTTKNFATYCPAGATVYVSNSTTSDLVSVACKKNDFYSTIIINKGDEAINVTLNLENVTATNITNLETGDVYTVTSNTAEIGILEQYGIFYLGTGEYPTLTNPAPRWSNNITVNITADLYAVDGLKNSTFKLYNSTGDLINQTETDYTNEESSVFSKVLELIEGVYHWFMSIWDDEGKNTVTQNYTLTVDTTFPTFTEVSEPTGNTENRSVILEWNITEQYLDEVMLHWNGTNTTVIDYSDVVLHYNFNNLSSLGENDTHVVDLSPSSSNGTVKGGENISWTPNGKYDGAFNFSGAGTNYINNPNFADGENFSRGMTISFWFKHSGRTNVYAVAKGNGCSDSGNNTGWGVQFWEQTLLFKTCRGNQYSFDQANAGTYTNDTWQHFVGIYYYNQNLTTYLDGVIGQKDTSIDPKMNSTSDFRIGQSVSGYNLNGSIDDLIIFNRSLSDSEVKELYLSQLTKYDSENWSFETNKTISSSNSSTSYNYYSCFKDFATNENCTTLKTINKISESETITTRFSTLIGNIRDDFYGVKDYHVWFADGVVTPRTYIMKSDVNGTWNQEKFLESNFGAYNQRVYLDYLFSNKTSQFEINITDEPLLNAIKEELIFFDTNDIDFTISIVNMPDYLQNRSSPYCNSTNWRGCPANNWTAYNELILYLLDYITENQTYNLYSVEVGNEPYGSGTGDFSWLNAVNYENITKATEYVIWFNNTYTTIKNSDYSYLKVFGPTGFTATGTPNIMNTFVSNFSYLPELYITIHPYVYENNATKQYIYMEDVKDLCDTYSANCSVIKGGEWELGTKLLSYQAGNDSYYFNQLMNIYADSYSQVLNYLPSIMSMAGMWHWSESNAVTPSSNPSSYYEGIVDQVENYVPENFSYQFKSAYNVTKNFATYCPAGSTVYSSSSTDSLVKTVTCKEGNDYSVIVINTDTEARNITINQLPSTIEDLVNIQTLESYPTTSQLAYPGTLDAYGIFYLTTIDPTITVISPDGADENSNPVLFSITTDEDATCKYSLNGGTTNTTMTSTLTTTHQASQTLGDGNYNVIFYCNSSINNENSASQTFRVYDTTGKTEEETPDDTGGSGGGVTSGTVVTTGEPVDPVTSVSITVTENLSSSDIFKFEYFIENWTKGDTNEIEIFVYDINRYLIDAEKVEVILDKETIYEEVSRINTGKYVGKFKLDESIDEVKMKIIVTKGDEKIEKSLSITIQEKEQMDKFLEFIQNPYVIAVAILITFAGLFIILRIFS